MKNKIGVVWMRADMRLSNHGAIDQAIASDLPFIIFYLFPGDCLAADPASQRKKNYIQHQLLRLNKDLQKNKSYIISTEENLEKAWSKLIAQYDIHKVFYLLDFDAVAKQQIVQAERLWHANGIVSEALEADLIFQPDEILKADGLPYKKFTAYKNACYRKLPNKHWPAYKNKLNNLLPLPDRKKPNTIAESSVFEENWNASMLADYPKNRNLPAVNGTSKISVGLAYGTRSLVATFQEVLKHQVFADELLWRNFFIQIMHHFPHAADRSFKPAYDAIQWRNKEKEFELWCSGNTGFPMVDAGMRQLNATGWMHNRVRMITASFLCKQLLIDWRWGMDYFAQQLLDHQFAVNNGNWQWCAGTGCDSAPYFRVFNPDTQLKKFDPKHAYVKHWIPELDSDTYPKPMLELKEARLRALQTYKAALMDN